MDLKNFKHWQGKGFPLGFKELLTHTSCFVCPMSKGARPYKHSATFKERGQQRVPTQHAGTLEIPDEDEITVETAEAEQEELPADGRVDISIDFAHAITVGKNKERYYLVIAAHGVEFTWGVPTSDRERPELHLQQFLDLTGLRLRNIRHDDTAEFARSSSFRAWAASVHATLCPVAGYKHTLNGKAEGAVRIAKEHVRCLLRASNLPRRFWPWAVTHWHRIYAYWVKKNGQTGWDGLPSHTFNQSAERDLAAPWGCYVIGHMSREHPLVKSDTTHEDRALEGAFLGWDLTTPTFWMWSFRLKQVVRLEGPRFSKFYPFRNPEAVVNNKHF